jgi:hypothetical protein
MTGRPDGAGAGTSPAWFPAVLPTGVLLLVVAMAVTVLGIPVAPLFRPGTWLILVALLTVAAGAAMRLSLPANDA